MYWKTLNGDLQSVQEVSSTLDGHGWQSSWRITDDAAATLWNADDGQGNENWLFDAMPNVWILETKTMKIFKTDKLDGPIDVLEELQAL